MELQFLGIGNEGLLFTNGVDLFMVWNSNDGSGDIRWTGMKVSDTDAAFTREHRDLCGAEIDMRQSPDDPFTPEIMELGDAMATAIYKAMSESQNTIEARWKAIKKKGNP